METIEVHFKLNGKSVALTVNPLDTLAKVLRENMELTGTKTGCGIGECGACTVVLNGKSVTSCIVPVAQIDQSEIVTIEGVSESEIGAILQKCFLEQGAIQCGYCTPGMVMSGYALLLHQSNPTKDDVKKALSGNLCRCTGYQPIINAILKAGELCSEGKNFS